MPRKRLYLTIQARFKRLRYKSMLLRKKSLYSQIISVCGTICATSAKNDGRNALQVRKFPDGFALPLALKSVQNRCEIFNGFYLKFRPIKVYRGALKIFAIKFSIFFSSFFTSILTIGGDLFFSAIFFRYILQKKRNHFV